MASKARSKATAKIKRSRAVNLVLGETLYARARKAAEVEGFSLAEFLRACAVEGCRRAEALAARQARTSKATGRAGDD